ncbi:MAG: hypothetical protein GXP25_08290 [Planctomycetes bacterium]|nr:hypothetical protein [Planctomycetota bacterium]
MIQKTVALWTFACLLCVSTLQADTAKGARALDKKLIQYGWGVPTPDFIRANIREMEKRPFDGLIFQLRGGRNVLQPVKWDEAKFAEDYENCKAIQWKRFTDNFIIMLAASDQDWFNDAHWEAIENNVRLVARGARLARCVGVCFDAEPYGGNPWSYTQAAHKKTKSFAEYEAIARRRGAQYIRAVESELPGAKIMTFFQLSYFDQLLVPMDPKVRAEKLSSLHYALLPAFLNGMLDAASPDVRIIDGNEGAYYYTKPKQYYRNYHTVAQRGLLLVDPNNWAKYHDQVQVGNALYVDQYFGLRTRKVLGHYLTPDERPKWFEHNIYWALYTADKYVWCYSERMHWFKNQNIPPGAEAAIRSARKKLGAGEPLGIDILPLVEAGEKRRKAEIQKRLVSRTATIHRLPNDVPKPKIDAVLDDAAWKRTAPLAPLLALAATPSKLGAQTQAWVTYDTEGVYVAVRCEEPQPKRMKIVGEKHDDDVWSGEDVEVMIAPPGRTSPFFHFMLNPKGVAWDSDHGKVNNLKYDPQWTHAARIGAKEWTAEMAIPWAALKMQMPKPGTTLRANVCRQRRHAHELSAWSPMVKGFLEHELFGTWVLK